MARPALEAGDHRRVVTDAVRTAETVVVGHHGVDRGDGRATVPEVEAAEQRRVQAAGADDAGRAGVAFARAVGRGRALAHVDPAELLTGEEDFDAAVHRSEEHTSELQSLMRISYAVFCLKKKTTNK